jgi:peptidase E
VKRLILMGGRPWVAQDGGERLARALLRHTGKEVKLAFCIFAQPESEWEQTRQWNIKMFNNFAGDKKLVYQTMTDENCEELSAWADVIYMPGGDTYELMRELKKHPDLASLWDDKIVAGSSAGADALCECFVYLQSKSFGEGLGWVQASCIPHWQHYVGYEAKDWDFIEAEALKRRSDLPVLCIPEGQFVEITV